MKNTTQKNCDLSNKFGKCKLIAKLNSSALNTHGWSEGLLPIKRKYVFSLFIVDKIDK